MVIFKIVSDLQAYLKTEHQRDRKVGFIPTMGALHEGHISLVERSKNEGMLTVCSIFLNPTQFNDKNDYDKYPVSTDKDIAMLALTGCDVLLLPSVKEVYPDGTAQMMTFDFGYLDTILEGAQREGHFKGVGQVVARLLNIVQPDTLYLGQKDYQQCMVITRLKDIMSLHKLNITICPTLREPDGLAMSSRNRRLTEGQRTLAGILYQCLVSIQSKKDSAAFGIVQKECIDLMERKGFETEYVALADASTLELMDNYDAAIPMVALIAARIGGVRLIDNILLN